MKNRRTRMAGILLSAAVLLILTVGTGAGRWQAYGAQGSAAGEERVLDGAGLFSARETEELEQQLASLRAETKMDAVLVTTDDTGGKSARDYADDTYDEQGFGTGSDKSGVLFLIDLDNREMWISTTGKMIRYLTDDRISSMLDHAYEYAQEGNFAGCAGQMIADTAHWYRAGIPGDQVTYNEDTGEISRYRSIRWYEALIALAIAGFCGGTACLNVKRQYAMEEQRRQAANFNMAYRANARFNYVDPLDVLVNAFVTQQILARNVSGGSGGHGSMGGGHVSTTHMSGGGHTHGGGGRKF